MKTLDEIKKYTRLHVDRVAEDGGCGIIHIGIWDGSVIWSFGGGWDHVSVCPFKRNITPTWDDMTKLKRIFFEDNEAVIQIHPQKSEYVNNMPNCLHLWKYQGDFPLPPAWMIGVRKGESVADVLKQANEELDVVR